MQVSRVVIFLVVFLQLYSPWGYAQLTFVAMDHFPPYSWTENGKKVGIDVDIIRVLSERSGIPMSIRFTPWKRVLNDIEKGKADGAFSFFYTKEREGVAIYIPTPIHNSTYKLFVLKGAEFYFQSIKDLSGKSIGKNRGFYINEAFREAEKSQSIDVIEANTMVQNIEKLTKNRIDALVGNQQEVYYHLSKLGLSNEVVALPTPINLPKGAYLVISKVATIENKERIVQQLTDSLRTMKEEGVLEEIYARYGDKRFKE